MGNRDGLKYSIALLDDVYNTPEQTSRQADEQTSRQADKQTSRRADEQTSRQADKQTSRQADEQTSRQADKQTSRQADKRGKRGEISRSTSCEHDTTEQRIFGGRMLTRSSLIVIQRRVTSHLPSPQCRYARHNVTLQFSIPRKQLMSKLVQLSTHIDGRTML
jgi:hypothetical protein